MNSSFLPQTPLPEMTLRVIILSIFLALVLAMSNAFLALKIGILASASIPAAIISMGILRFYKNSNILENNLVQTAASAGEAVAGGVVYTTPALVLIHYWDHFSYWENFWIALLGGCLGVLFSVPIRRVLVTNPALQFPEGRAIAQVLLAGEQQHIGIKDMLMGGAIGALIELCQTGFKIFASSLQYWFSVGKTMGGFGLGFSPTMLGVGYLVGFRLGLSLLIGALILWLLGVPVGALFYPEYSQANAALGVIQLWEAKLRYVGVGAMLVAGLMTVSTLLKPFILSLQESVSGVNQFGRGALPRTEQDIPLQYVLLGIGVILFALYIFFNNFFPHFSTDTQGHHLGLAFIGVVYILIFGFIFSAMTGYFSGMVGVTASPGSAVIIASLIVAALGLRFYLQGNELLLLENSKLNGAAITILLGAIITGIAAIANDNIQDLKVGQLVGATPWKQQVMLMLGVFVSALVIPIVMQLLFNVYGVGDVLPRPGMDPTQALPAPPAALMAAVTQAVFNYSLEWSMMGIGGFCIIAIKLLNYCLPEKNRLSLLGVGIGMYLPLATSVPLFLGSCISLLNKGKSYSSTQKVILIACGLVSGAAVMNVLLAIPFAVTKNPDVLNLVGQGWQGMSHVLGMGSAIGVMFWLYRSARVTSKNS